MRLQANAGGRPVSAPAWAESTDDTMPRRLGSGQWWTGDGSDRQRRL